MNKYKPNDTVFLVESNRFIREAAVKKYAGGLYLIKFKDSGGGIKVREDRLFPTREKAEASIRKPKLKKKSQIYY